MDPMLPPIEPTGQRERTNHILDAAGELLVRWGYKRVTIEDVAQLTGIGTGTIYQYWKNKEALFESVMLREAIVVWQELLARVRANPEEVLIHRVMRTMLLVTRQRPLAQALFTRDMNLLGKLSQGRLMRQTKQMVPAQEFLGLLRRMGLVRSDMTLTAQTYAFGATIVGFSVADPILGDEVALPLEEKAEAMAQTIRSAFEPEIPPSRATLQAEIVPTMVQMLEQVCTSCEQLIQERMIL